MYSRHWLRVGTKIEMEHANPRASAAYNRARAERIAKQHLREFKSYYQVLPGAEKRMAAIDRANRRKR